MNFPSKWLDFTSHKELKRLRKDINNTKEIKIQIAASLIIAIISFYLNNSLSSADEWTQIALCLTLFLAVLAIFVAPSIINWCSMRQRSNTMIGNKDAVSIFDDEITYNVLTACEYYNSKNSTIENDLSTGIKEFYDLEIKYYTLLSIELLSSFTANASTLIGESRGKIKKKE